eukprot:2671773-Amphidinium_carterae.1
MSLVDTPLQKMQKPAETHVAPSVPAPMSSLSNSFNVQEGVNNPYTDTTTFYVITGNDKR